MPVTAADTIKDLHVQVKRCPECGTGFGREAAFCPFDGIALQTGTWDPTRDPLTDTVIDNRYEVMAPLGEGGMGTVYKVRHTTLDRLFAMKVLRRDLASDAMLAARFLQEARATAAIRHSSVVAINDFGELDDGAPYFVMELLVGETLATRMRARGILPPREAATIASKLADALGAAHAANVVHRDLKPENVFLVGVSAGKSAADEVRVVDFGAAKIMGGSKLTRPGVVFGTPYYMSPEQASGQPVDARADIYSLGVLLYEMITGALPFEADTYMGVLTKHMFAAPVKPSERTPTGVQLGDLETVVLRALEKDPAARFATMAELSAAVQRAIDVRPSEAPKATTRSGRTVAFGSAPSAADRIQRSVSRHVEEEKRRKRRGIVVAAVSAAVTLSVCAVIVSVLDDAKSSKSLLPAPPRVAAPPSSPSLPLPPPPSMTSMPAVPDPDPPSGAPATITATVTATAPPAVTTTSVSASRPAPSTPKTSPAAGTTNRTAPPAAPRTKAPDDLPDPWGR
ncbi:MAG: serine/threonine protein kinase [Myxococcaceae bacterium]|nr:serine/threonine protein kinase [Myxococcaceae bacterium]